jgi:hypothetical protein
MTVSETISNTGSYQWTIPESLALGSIIGTTNRFLIVDVANHNVGDESNFFTITN